MIEIWEHLFKKGLHMEVSKVKENLEDAGCDHQQIEEILRCCKEGKMKQVNLLIGKCRKEVLDKVHTHQQCLDRLDYLTYCLMKEENKQ